MQVDVAALPLVRDLDLKAEDVAELTLQRVKIGIERLPRVPGTCAADVRVGSWTPPFTTRALFSLANGKAFGDDFPGEFFRVVSRGHGTSVAHADIALQ